jgi:hypothetical protein
MTTTAAIPITVRTSSSFKGRRCSRRPDIENDAGVSEPAHNEFLAAAYYDDRFQGVSGRRPGVSV